jgi:hypothetical protein
LRWKITQSALALRRWAFRTKHHGWQLRSDIWLLRLRALLAEAQGDDIAYREFADRYHDMATSLGFEGHMTWAEAMP